MIKRSVSLITLFLLPLAVASLDNCSNSKCLVSTPFRTPEQPATCGLPGFDLGCDFPYKTPTLSFPSSSQTFAVGSISYYSYEIKLSDPQGCLQEKLLRFDSSNTPFRFQYSSSFPLYNCSRSKLPGYYYWGLEIGCLSGSNYTVMCDKGGFYSLSTSYGCEFIGYAMGPGTWGSYDFSSAKSVVMVWDLPPDCQRCRYGGAGCLRDPNDIRRVKCTTSPSPPPVQNSAKIVLPIIATPILLALICLGICCKARRSAARGAVTNNTMLQSHLDTPSNTNRQSSVLPSGVEQGTLDAYPTTVVGESGRMLVNMEDKTCPICLSEYEPKETLKTLPECLHRFHVECIDEWLRAKALCPVCRTPPPRRSS